MAPTFIPGDHLCIRWFAHKGAKVSSLAVDTIIILERDEQPGIFYIKRITQIADEGIWVSSDNPKGTDSRMWGWMPPHVAKGKYLFRIRKALRNT